MIDTSKVGGGFPDLVVAGPGGRWVLVEVKSDGGRLTEEQAVLKQEADLVGAPYLVVFTEEEAIRMVQEACL